MLAHARPTAHQSQCSPARGGHEAHQQVQRGHAAYNVVGCAEIVLLAPNDRPRAQLECV